MRGKEERRCGRCAKFGKGRSPLAHPSSGRAVASAMHAWRQYAAQANRFQQLGRKVARREMRDGASLRTPLQAISLTWDARAAQVVARATNQLLAWVFSAWERFARTERQHASDKKGRALLLMSNRRDMLLQ